MKVLVFGVLCRVLLMYGLEQVPLRLHTREVGKRGTGLGVCDSLVAVVTVVIHLSSIEMRVKKEKLVNTSVQM